MPTLGRRKISHSDIYHHEFDLARYPPPPLCVHMALWKGGLIKGKQPVVCERFASSLCT